LEAKGREGNDLIAQRGFDLPGHILRAQCDCGFECELYPGANKDGVGRVIAYTNDGTDLRTFDQDAAARKQLIVLRDPFLLDPDEHDYFERLLSVKAQFHAPFRCPSCGKDSLLIRFAGHWD
jgi:hypothetical protein